MNQKDKNPINRRDFVKGGAIAIGATACLSFGLREAIAHANATGKIILTADNLNRLFAEKRAAGRIRSVAAEISRDIKGWLKRECSLTPIQERAIQSVSDADWSAIKKALKLAEDSGGTIRVQISEEKALSHHSSALAKCKGKVKVTVEGEVGGVKVKTEAEASAET